MEAKKKDAPDERRKEGQRKPLRQAVAEIDQDILRMVMRRQNLLAKMRKNGRIEPAEEKYLRESWQKAVARVSRDQALSSQFFTLMQRVGFLPRPEEAGGREARKDAFNLAPSTLPARIDMTVPFCAWSTCAWLYLACAAGQPMRLFPCLQNDAIVDCIQMLAQMGGAVTRDEDACVVRAGSPLGAPDKVLHAGASAFNLYLILAHYLGRHSHVKITGSRDLQLADLSAISAFLPRLGARLVHLVPTSSGLPARLEASGMLPPGLRATAELPAQFLEAVIFAAPAYEEPFSIDLSAHPQKTAIIAHVLPILEACAATFLLQGDSLCMSPCTLRIERAPHLPMDAELAAFLLAIAAATSGEANLAGSWPIWPDAAAIAQILRRAGWRMGEKGAQVDKEAPLRDFEAPDCASLPPFAAPLLACLAACACLRGGTGKIAAPSLDNANVLDFLRAAGLEADADGLLKPLADEYRSSAWNAPFAAWALALAAAACARQGKTGWPLGNPGIITAIWPQFWSFYNSLPEPTLKKADAMSAPAPKQRRRIVTNVVAVPPEIRDEDWR